MTRARAAAPTTLRGGRRRRPSTREKIVGAGARACSSSAAGPERRSVRSPSRPGSPGRRWRPSSGRRPRSFGPPSTMRFGATSTRMPMPRRDDGGADGGGVDRGGDARPPRLHTYAGSTSGPRRSPGSSSRRPAATPPSSALWERMNANRAFGVRWAAKTLLGKPGRRKGLRRLDVEAAFWIALDWGTFRTLTRQAGLTAGSVRSMAAALLPGRRSHRDGLTDSATAPLTAPGPQAARAPRSPAPAGRPRPRSAPAPAARARRNSSPSRARQVRDRPDGALLPEEVVRERRDVAHVDAGADDACRPCRRARSAAGTSSPTGAKMIAASSGSGGRSSEPPAQTAPSSRANVLAAASPGRVKAKTRRPCAARDLRHDVRRRAEAVEPEALRVAGHAGARGSRSGRRRAAARPASVGIARRESGSSSARRRPSYSA